MLSLSAICIPVPIAPNNFDDYYSICPRYSVVRKVDDDIYRNLIVINEDNVKVFYPLDEKVNFLLSKFNNVENSIEVYSYLLQNEYLLDLLNESLEELKKYFPDDIKVGVSVIDNSMEDESNQLSILISSNKKEFLFDELDDFDYGWWLSKIHKSNGLLVFHV